MSEFMKEIDGIRRVMEAPCTDIGDYTSDEFYRAIDMSTSPSPLSFGDELNLASASRRLNRVLDTTVGALSIKGLTSVYDDVVTQMNEINADRALLLSRVVINKST